MGGTAFLSFSLEDRDIIGYTHDEDVCNLVEAWS